MARRQRQCCDSNLQEIERLWQTFALTIGKVSVFIVLMLVVGRRLFPWLLWQIARTGSRELFTLCIVAAAVGIAYGSAELFGVSFALGAFFAGMVMRESPLSYRAAEESLPLRDAFSVLFFVSVGMLFEPDVLIREPLHVRDGSGDHHLRQIDGGFRYRASVPLPAQHGAYRIGKSGANRRVLVHPGSILGFPWDYCRRKARV